MKKLISLLVLASSFAMAGEIKITSLTRIENGNFTNKGAEVCGYVQGVAGEMQLVKITADPGSNPGIYWTFAAGSEDRKHFCQVLALYGNRVEASINDLKSTKSL